MDYADNIKAVFEMATPEEVRDGIVWYANAQAEAKRIARDTETPLHTVVGVMAALSPNNKWERNVENARALIEAFMAGDAVESVKVSTYHAMKAKAWSILEEMPDTPGRVVEILNGQKIISFFCNIMGHDTCTVDGHALNIARGRRVGLTTSGTNIGKKLYTELQEAYAKAGRGVVVNGRALKAFEMQAITWVAWKRIHNV